MPRLWGYIESCSVVEGMPRVKVMDGSMGEDSFTIRYSTSPGIVRVKGRIRARAESFEVLLQFREEHISPSRLLITVAATAVVGVFLHAPVVDWIQWGGSIVVGTASLFLPVRGTTAGLAEALSGDLGRVLDAVAI